MLLTMDGFDLYPGNTSYAGYYELLARGWNPSYLFAIGITLTGGKYGQGAATIVRADNNDHSIYRALSSTKTTVIAQTFVRPGTTLGSCIFFEMWYGAHSALVMRLKTTAAGALELYNCNGILIATSAANVIRSGTYHHLQVKCTSADSTGTVVVRVDNANIFVYSGNIDTAVGNVGIDRVYFFSCVDRATETRYDDIIIMDNTGLAPRNDFIGECRICTLLPNADTAMSDFTRSSGSNDYEMVDDAIPGNHDVDATYIWTNSLGAKSMFDVGNLSITPSAIYAVQHSVVLDKTTSDTRQARGLVSSNSVVQNGATRSLNTAYLYYQDLIEQDPDGPKEWTKAAIDALQIGVEVVL